MKKSIRIILLIMITFMLASSFACNKARSDINDSSSTHPSNSINESTSTSAPNKNGSTSSPVPNISGSTSTPTSNNINESAPSPSPNNINESTPSPFPLNSYQKYMGSWDTGFSDEEDLTIWETNNTYKLLIGFFRITTIHAIAEIESNNKLKFSATDGPTINGTLEFNENSILVTIDESDFEYIEAGTTIDFTNQISQDNPSETTNSTIKCDNQLCTADENVLFSFKVENSQKVLSICEAKDKSYIVYRYGTKDNIELEYPEDKTSCSGFSYYYEDTPSNVPTEFLSFTNRGYSYVISEYNSDKSKSQLDANIYITDLSTYQLIAIIKAQSGSVTGHLSSLKLLSE